MSSLSSTSEVGSGKKKAGLPDHVKGAPTIRASISEVLTSLKSAVNSHWAWPRPVDSFALWVSFPDTKEIIGVSIVEMQEETDGYRDRFSQSPILSSVGYLLACSRNRFSEEIINKWADSFGQLKNRKVFRRDNQSFLYRPEELLGLCLGARTLKERVDLDWLREIVQEAENEVYLPKERWNYSIGLLASKTLDVEWSEIQLTKDSPMEEDAIKLLAAAEELNGVSEFHATTDRRDLLGRFLHSLVTRDFSSSSVAKTACVASAGSWCVKTVLDEVVDIFYDEERIIARKKKEARQRKNRQQAVSARGFGRLLGRAAKYGVYFLLVTPLAMSIAKNQKWVGKIVPEMGITEFIDSSILGGVTYIVGILPGYMSTIAGLLLVIIIIMENVTDIKVFKYIGYFIESVVYKIWSLFVLGEWGWFRKIISYKLLL